MTAEEHAKNAIDRMLASQFSSAGRKRAAEYQGEAAYFYLAEFAEAIRQAVAEEREACARLCDTFGESRGKNIASEIRSRPPV